MFYTRCISTINFTSSDYDVNKARLSDLLYIAYSTIYPDHDIPGTKCISDRLKSFGITEVTICYDPDYKYTLTAKFRQYPDINKLRKL
jgi:hypothetical protein